MEKFISLLRDNIDAFEDVEIAPDTDLTKLPEWDSLALISIMSIAASEYGVILNAMEISGAGSVGAIYALIESKQ